VFGHDTASTSSNQLYLNAFPSDFCSTVETNSRYHWWKRGHACWSWLTGWRSLESVIGVFFSSRLSKVIWDVLLDFLECNKHHKGVVLRTKLPPLPSIRYKTACFSSAHPTWDNSRYSLVLYYSGHQSLTQRKCGIISSNKNNEL
jgi:hypothetical protein